MALEGIDDVDWTSVTHAYGEATDVPDMLRALLSDEAKQREQAIYDLFGNIWHQGTVYSATAKATPFLYELLTTSAVEDKAAIAEGVGYLEVHAVGDYGEPSWRKILTEQGKSLEDEMAGEAAEIHSVHHAVSAGLKKLLPYLNDSDAEVRRSVASALGNYPEHGTWSLPALDRALESESDSDVQRSIQESKDRLIRRLNLNPARRAVVRFCSRTLGPVQVSLVVIP